MILIVDDKSENIIALKGLLTLHGFTVDSALSGEEALNKILKNSYSLIILDVQMPGMDGFEVAEAILGFNKSKDTPIIFLSAVSTEKKFITQGYTSGGLDYVTKPVDPDIMLLKVKTFYRLSEQTRELNRIQTSLKKEIETRKTAENKLDGTIKELRSVMEALPLMAFTLNAEGNIEYVNQHWFEYSTKKNKFPLPHPEDENIFNDWKVYFLSGEEFICELRIKQLKTNDYRYKILRIVPIIQNSVIIKWVGTYTDIHEQKSINQLLEVKVDERTRTLTEKNKELENSNHELQQFAWVVSHDLKEPLRKIQTFNNIVKDKHLTGDVEGRKFLDKSILSSERMARLINDLLEFSRLSVTSMFQPTNLNDLLNEVLSDFKYLIDEKKVIVKKDILPEIDSVPSQMRQIFQNLVSNAIKFSKGEVPVITIKSERLADKSFNGTVSETGDYYRFTFSDNGIGFDEAHLDKIFVIFQRLHTQSTHEGTGIGLAIAKKIVDKHNGIITATGKEGEGASFILVLPIYNTLN